MTDQTDPIPEIAFHPLTHDDLAMLERWLHAPHVRQWWGEPRDAAQIADDYGPCLDGTDPTRLYLILAGGRPVGMMQCYRHDDNPEWDRTVGIPRAAGIDYLIGEPGVIGRGIGSRAIAHFSALVFATYSDLDAIVAAPQAANRASCRALEKAGYALAELRTLESDDPMDAGPSAIYLLRRG
jgi:RimJ/RimL family protein N-acetyltransferase